MGCISAAWSVFAQGMPVVPIPRIDVMPEYSGAPSIAQVAQDRAVVVWCAAEEMKFAIYASGVIARLGSADDHPVRVAEVNGLTMVQPLVAAVSEGYVVVWQQPDGAHAVVLGADGSTNIPPQPIVASAVPLAIATAFDETLLAFAVQSTAPCSEWRVGIAFLTDTAGIAKLEWIDTLQTQPHAALTPAGEGFLLAYSERQSSNPMLVRRVTPESISAASSVGDAGYSDSLAIAASPNGALAIWSVANSGRDFVARHLDLNGHATGDAFRIIPGGSNPDVAWDGSNYLVTYSVPGEVRIAFASESATSLARDMAVGPGGTSRVVSDGTTSTLAWSHPSSGTLPASHGTVDAAGIDSSGRVISTMTVSHNFTRQDQPAAASAGDATLVAWTEQTGRDARSVFATRIDRDGRSLDPDVISLHDGRIQGAPAVASNGSEFLVVWPEYDQASNSNRIIGQRIANEGAPDALGGPFEITALPLSYPTDVTVAWNGENYLVAWPMSFVARPDRWIETALVLPTGVVRARNYVAFPKGFEVLRNIRATALPNGFLLTVEESHGTFPGIAVTSAYLVPLDRSGAAAGPARGVSDNGEGTAVAASGDRALVVWSEPDKRLLGQYFDASANYVSSPFTIYREPTWGRNSVVSDGTGFVVAFDTGEFMPLLATIRGSDVTGISIASEPSLRNDPATALVARPSGLLSVFRAVDETWTNVARVYTRNVPGSGAVDVAADLAAPAEAHAGSIVHVRLRVANVGTQLATGIEAHLGANGNRVVSFPIGCQTDSFFVDVLCPVQDLQPGSTAFLHFDVVIDADASPIEAKVFAHEQDPVTANNVAAANVKLTGTARMRSIRR